MSFTLIEEAPPRLNRVELAVPGSRPEFFEKAAASAADIVFLDLEDAVAPDTKPRARRNVIAATHEVDWGERTLSVRINGLDTPFMYRDLVEVLEEGSERIDLVMIPKVGTAADVHTADVLATQIEAAMGRKKRVGFELIIETALGMENIHAIARASRRNESLHFGVGDFAASTGARVTSIGGPNPDYAILGEADAAGRRAVHPADMWHYALARMVVAARANGLRPVDGPYGDIADLAGLEAQARRVAVLGCEGKWAIHPSQIVPLSAIFTPPDEAVAEARRILEAMEEARQAGRGAVTLDGRMIDIVSIRQAEALVAKAERIGRG